MKKSLLVCMFHCLLLLNVSSLYTLTSLSRQELRNLFIKLESDTAIEFSQMILVASILTPLIEKRVGSLNDTRLNGDHIAPMVTTAAVTLTRKIVHTYQDGSDNLKKNGVQMLKNVAINTTCQYVGMQTVDAVISVASRFDCIDVETNKGTIKNLQRVAGIMLTAIVVNVLRQNK